MAKIEDFLATNPGATPYTWEALKNGILIGVECPPTATREETFAAIGFTERWLKVGNTDLCTFLNSTPDAVTIRAKSVRLTTHPHIENIEIRPGDSLVWAHRSWHFVYIMGAVSTLMCKQTMLIGRETAAGEIKIAYIQPTGEMTSFNAYADALAATLLGV